MEKNKRDAMVGEEHVLIMPSEIGFLACDKSRPKALASGLAALLLGRAGSPEGCGG